MITDSGIDFGNLSIEEQIKINQKAYANYYKSCYANFDDIEFTTEVITDLKLKHDSPLMYNSWYGTELHKKFVIPLLRKMKLDKIKKADN